MKVNHQQSALFGPSQNSLPEGFSYVPNFINEGEEQLLLKEIESLDLGHLTIQGVPSKRRIRHFGVGYSFETKKLTEAVPIPSWILPLRSKAAKLIGVSPESIPEVLITEYKPGSGISWHVDAHPFGVIVGVSLLGSSRLKLRDAKNHKLVEEVLAEPRSAYILSGKARTEWQHSIPAVKELRYSITFRTLK